MEVFARTKYGGSLEKVHIFAWPFVYNVPHETLQHVQGMSIRLSI